MSLLAKQCFPNATIVIDCFHIVKRLCEGLESIRLKFKRIAITENRKAAAAFAKEEERKARQRAYYRKFQD
ncbi:MAG: transposase [Parabacteroides sp.]|nr:transposase [Parabacteroides sp.]